jgi:hypothetical protein
MVEALSPPKKTQTSLIVSKADMAVAMPLDGNGVGNGNGGNGVVMVALLIVRDSDQKPHGAREI